MREKRERGEQTGTTGRVKGEGEKRECPYLLINRPFRKGKTPKIPRGRKKMGGHPGGMVVMKLVVGATEKRRRVPPTPSANRVAFLVGGSWESTNSLELQRKNTRKAGRSCDLTF